MKENKAKTELTVCSQGQFWVNIFLGKFIDNFVCKPLEKIKRSVSAYLLKYQVDSVINPCAVRDKMKLGIFNVIFSTQEYFYRLLDYNLILKQKKFQKNKVNSSTLKAHGLKS